jgi:WD40 repeat protein/serine/threonine protein kinase
MPKPLPAAAATSSALRESCADLIRRLRRGEVARAEQYLGQFPALAADDDAAVELIYTEFATREELGRRPTEAEFFERFPVRREALRRQFDIHRLLAEGLPLGHDDDAVDAAGPSDADGTMPARLGAYELLRPLGRGGMGVVYLARHGELGRPAALKLLSTVRGDDEALAERFRTEVRSAAALGHPQIVQLYELGKAPDGRTFAAFEYVDGGSLQQAIGGRPRPARDAAALLLKLAEATACAHRAGIVHCDLTPANILLTREGEPKIADFGLARLPRRADDATATNGDSATADDPSLTALAGTPGYLAPERIDRPEAATPAVDVYGLGAIFYELLTGRPPFVGATPLETLRRARSEDPTSPRTVVPSVPHDAATICLKCLAHDPARRYADGAELADDVRRFLAGEPIAARPVGRSERAWKWMRRRPGLAAALVVASAALVALVVGGTFYNLRLTEAYRRTAEQELQIRQQAGDLAQQLDQVRRNVYTLQLNQAEALVDRAPHQAVALLHDVERCPPAERDFAWGLLLARASQDRRTLVGHEGPIAAIAWTGDERIVTAARDDTVAQWNAADGARVDVLAVPLDGAKFTSLSPGGSRLVAAYDDRTIRLWDLNGPEAMERTFAGVTSAITGLAFFPDGRWVAAIDESGRVMQWDPAGVRVAEFAATDGAAATALAIAPDGRTLAVGGSDGVVRLLDVVDGRRRGEFFGHAGGVAALAFADAGRKVVAVGALGGKIEVWDPATKTTTLSLDLGGSVVRLMTVDRDGRRLAFATTEHVVRVVDLTDGATLGEYRGHADRITGLVFSPDGTVLASAADDRTGKLWDVPGRKATTTVAGDDLKTLVTAFAPDDRTLAVAGVDGVIRLSDVTTERETGRLVGHRDEIRGLRFLDDGRRLLSCGEDATVRLWDVVERKQLRVWDHPAWVLAVGPDLDGNRFLSVAADGKVRRWTFDAVEPTTLVSLPSAAITTAVIAENGAYVVAGAGLTITAYRVQDGSLRTFTQSTAEAGHVKDVVAVAISREGVLASGDDGGVVVVRDLWKGYPRHALRGHSRGVYGLAFSPDGRTLASASGGRWIQATGEVKLWDVVSGQAHATLDGGTAPLAFSPGGLRLAVSDDAERVVRIWPAAEYRTDPPALRPAR